MGYVCGLHQTINVHGILCIDQIANEKEFEKIQLAIATAPVKWHSSRFGELRAAQHVFTGCMIGQ